MDLLETIEDVLEQEDHILPKKENDVKIEYTFDEDMFNKMANFIVNLDPDKLTIDQIDKVIEMIEDIKMQANADDDVQEKRIPKLAKRTPLQKNQASKKWYRTHRSHVRRREKKLARSAEGKRREAREPRLARQNKTPTERKKLRYHVRKRSKRRDRDATLNR